MSDDARDMIEQDLARHDRLVGRNVAATRNQALAAEALELADKQPKTPPSIAPAPAPVLATVERKQVDGREYTLEREPDSGPMYRKGTEFENNVIRHAQPRIELLLSKNDEGPVGQPSWCTRTLAAMFFKIKSLEAAKSGKQGESDAFEMAFQQDLYELLEESNKVFGDWRKDAPGKLIVTVTR